MTKSEKPKIILFLTRPLYFNNCLHPTLELSNSEDHSVYNVETFGNLEQNQFVYGW